MSEYPKARYIGKRTFNGRKATVYAIEGHAGLWLRLTKEPAPACTWDEVVATVTYRGECRPCVFVLARTAEPELFGVANGQD